MDALRKLRSLGSRKRSTKAEVASGSSPKVKALEAEKNPREAEKSSREAEKSSREAEKSSREAEKSSREAEKSSREEEKSSREEEKSSREEEPHSTGLSPIKVRTPSEKGEHGDAESVGSADSFDSALERMAASSITSFEPPSPVGSVDARSQFEGGTVEGIPEREQGGNLYAEYDDDDDEEEESEEETSGSSSEYSSSASNTEDELDYIGASSVRGARPVRSEKDHEEDEAGVEDDYEEAYGGGIDLASEALENTPSGGRMEDPESKTSSRDLTSTLERTVPRQEFASAENDDDENVVKAPVTESRYDDHEDAQEGHDVQEEEKIIEVAREHNLGEGEEEEVESLVIKEEQPKDVAEDRSVLAIPAHATLGRSESGDTSQTEQVQSSSGNFVRSDYSGEGGDSDGDAEDEYYEDDEDEEDEDYDDGGDTGAKAQLHKAGLSGSGHEDVNKSSMGAAGPSLPSLPKRPTRKAVSATDTAGRITQNPTASSPTQLASTTEETIENEGNDTREKLQNIRVKFLRLAHRLGQSPQNQVVAQVLYRLGLAESLRGSGTPNRTGAFSFDRVNAMAMEAEATHQEEDLDFACTILVLGQTGVGKSATINSLFDERKSLTSAFSPSTKKVHEIVGTVHGIKMRVIDTPGLLPSTGEQRHNEKIMGQVKSYIKKSSPDIVLYFDRLDMQSRDLGDVPLLRTITDVFGAAIWFNAIVVLTHAGSAPPDGPNGASLSYDMFLAHRSHVVQQTIRQAAGDMRLSNPVSLVENHPACRTNRNGQRVLPNGQIWKSQLLLLCFASKILAEANTLLKLFETASPAKPFGQRPRVPPLPFLLSSLLQARAQLKMANELQGESDVSDDDDYEDEEEDDEYDELPPFRPLSTEELEELSKEQRHQYAEELADRERLFQKKQYREQIRRRKEMKKRAAAKSEEELPQEGRDVDEEAGQAASVPVPMPDMALPPSFDSDNPTHRYRYLETANQWLVRPVLETHGWDHDAGYDGFNAEKMFVLKDKIPASISGQVTKDKKEAQVSFEAAASLKHGEGKVTLTGLDIQTIGKDLAYTLRAETRFNNFKRNKTTAGLTCTVLNDTIAAGLKLEDSILVGKRIKMVVNGGVLTGKGDKAFGGSLEATLRGKEYPLSRTLSTLGLSVMDWHGDLAIGGNLQSQFMLGKTMMVGRANLNNRGSGQLSIRASSSEQLQMVLIGIVPVLRSLINCRFGFGGQSSQ